MNTLKLVPHINEELDMSTNIIWKDSKSFSLARLQALTTEDKCYMAGFFDGEGSIGLYRKKQRGVFYAIAPRLNVSQITRDIPMMFWNAFGSRLFCMDRGSTPRTQNGIQHELRTNERCIWTWDGSSIAVIHMVLETLMPYLKIKKVEAELMLEYVNNVNKYTLDEKGRLVDQIAHCKRVEDRPTPQSEVA